MRTARDLLRRESGLSLIELMVSILLLSLIAMSFIPLMINGLRLADRAASITTATSIANNELDRLRVGNAACMNQTEAALTSVSDTRGGVYTPVLTMVCPSSYPGTAEVLMTIRNKVGMDVITLNTWVFVRGGA